MANENADAWQAKAEKLLETTPYKIYETVAKIAAPIFFLGKLAVGLWHFFTAPVPENSPSVIVGKAVYFTLSAGGVLVVAFLIAGALRKIFGSKGFVGWFLLAGLPIFLSLMVYIWLPIFQSRPTFASGISSMWTALVGLGGFVNVFVFPALHKLGVIDMTKAPPWERKR